MAEKFIRVYRKYEFNTIKPNLLIYGEISGSCANCNKIDIKLDQPICPSCKTEFKFISFRNVKSHLPKLTKIAAERPSVSIIDFEDYTHLSGSSKAENLFK